MPRRKEPRIPDAILDQLLAGADAKTAFDPNGLLDDLKKALAERVLNAEMDHHLAGEEPGNRRNGYGRKSVVTDTGTIELEVPRDRQASFDPQLIAKYQRRFPGFDDKIISMYARGMSTREIVGHLRDLYGIEVSPDLISAVTDAVLEEVAAWQARPLEATYPLVFFDALRVKIRDEGLVRNKAVHIALGVRADGAKEILGLWLEQNEGAKFWLRVMNELKNRGVEDVLIAIVDGLKGFPDAITAVFPQATVQTCIVHLLRHSLDFVSWKDRKPVAAALKDIYRAVDAAAAEAALAAFEDGVWGRKYPAIGQSWRRAWSEVIPFYAFPGDVRRILYTTDEIDKLFRRELLSWSARVTAWQRAGLEDASPITLPSVSFLVCGTRAPLCTPRLPLADEPFVGLLGMTRELDLTITQRFDIVGIRGARFASFPRRLPGFQLHRA
jgi:putative transposase